MIGIIGIGAMGGAIARGLIAAGAAPGELVVYSADVEANARFVRETGAKLAYSNVDLVERAGDGAIVVVAVKPFAVGGVLDEIRKAAARRGSVIVSVAAGTPIEFLESRLEPGQPVVRTMPIEATTSQTSSPRSASPSRWPRKIFRRSAPSRDARRPSPSVTSTPWRGQR